MSAESNLVFSRGPYTIKKGETKKLGTIMTLRFRKQVIDRLPYSLISSGSGVHTQYSCKEVTDILMRRCSQLMQSNWNPSDKLPPHNEPAPWQPNLPNV